MPLDRTLPYGEVWGHPGGVLYEQGGHMYNSKGRLVRIGPGDVVVEVDIQAISHEEPLHSMAPGEALRDHDTVEEVSHGRDWRTVTNEELKAQLAIYGLEWQGRASAIASIKSNMEIG